MQREWQVESWLAQLLGIPLRSVAKNKPASRDASLPNASGP